MVHEHGFFFAAFMQRRLVSHRFAQARRTRTVHVDMVGPSSRPRIGGLPIIGGGIVSGTEPEIGIVGVGDNRSLQEVIRESSDSINVGSEVCGHAVISG